MRLLHTDGNKNTDHNYKLIQLLFRFYANFIVILLTDLWQLLLQPFMKAKKAPPGEVIVLIMNDAANLLQMLQAIFIEIRY